MIPSSRDYRAIVDMGSNGIRFSITDMAASTARIMPTVYQDRVGISLYDAQWQTNQKGPIPQGVINDVVNALLTFKRTCEDFGVHDASAVRVIATEATRQAINSEAFRGEIQRATGWAVEMLPKEEEGRTGAMGVASSFASAKGLMMDLGGGSTQLTWLCVDKGEVRMSEAGSVSMPYGAAALSRRLAEANKLGGTAVDDLRDEITTALKDAVARIRIPAEILNSPDGLSLYLSGGGFRGWGFVLMSQHAVSPYPIPIINGFSASTAVFHDTELVKTTASSDADIFRASERRASQVPAVALLISCLATALPAISTVHFAQGGVREGALYSTLDAATRAQHPLVTATRPYVSPDSALLAHLLLRSSPSDTSALGPTTQALLTAFAQALYLHRSCPKDLQSAAALRSTTSGALASVHGASHFERAVLALLLCERWGGSAALSPADIDFHARLAALLGPGTAWWCLYFGRVGALLGALYPAGVVPAHQGRSSSGDRTPHQQHPVDISCAWLAASDADEQLCKQLRKDAQKRLHNDTNGDDGQHAVHLTIDFSQPADAATAATALRRLAKLGKRKNWPDADAGAGRRLHVEARCAGKPLDADDDGQGRRREDDDG